MGCYCSEIPKCRDDIETIGNIESILKRMDNYNYQKINNALKQMEANTSSAISPDNINSLLTEELTINDKFEMTIKDLMSDCQHKKLKLDKQLQSMIKSDKTYHKSKNKY